MTINKENDISFYINEILSGQQFNIYYNNKIIEKIDCLELLNKGIDKAISDVCKLNNLDLDYSKIDTTITNE